MVISKALAQRFCEMTPCPSDRLFSARRVEAYTRMAVAGEFRPMDWAECFCHETGDTYRVNGKHTSFMIHNATVELPQLFATVQSYEADTLEDLATLYSTFDSRMQTRTTNDINKAFAASVPDFQEIPLKIISLAVHGISYHEKLDNYTTVEPAQRAEKMLDNKDFVVWLNWILNDQSKSKYARKGPVVGAMFGTYLKSKAKAAEFWTAVIEETGVKPELPDRKLAKYLSTHSVAHGRGAALAARAQPREVYVKSLHAWNAWRRGENTTLKYIAGATVPAIR
jgi:hypothetical protein